MYISLVEAPVSPGMTIHSIQYVWLGMFQSVRSKLKKAKRLLFFQGEVVSTFFFLAGPEPRPLLRPPPSRRATTIFLRPSHPLLLPFTSFLDTTFFAHRCSTLFDTCDALFSSLLTNTTGLGPAGRHSLSTLSYRTIPISLPYATQHHRQWNSSHIATTQILNDPRPI